MASGLIGQVKIDNTYDYNIASTAYGTCSTGASNAIKDVTITGFNLISGITIHVKFTYENAANSPKLKFNGESDDNAKTIVFNDATAAGNINETIGWYAGAVVSFTYDGVNWVRDQGFNTNTWRGIQDNLTSSTNTTESLSAKQGYLLATGSARDDTKVNKSGDTMTGILNLTPATGEGGEIHLNASTANTTQAGIVLDQLNSTFRIFGVPSTDGTTKIGTGTPLVIDPYTATITGDYTITGDLIGNASTATSWANDRTVYVALNTASTSVTINGGASNASAIAIGVDGTLSVSNGGTGQTNLKDAANALINALDADSTNLTQDDYIITQYVGGSTTNTTYYRRPASKVINATLVKDALETSSTHNNQFLRKDGTWQTVQAGVSSVATLTGAITAQDLVEQLGLSTAMHFRGISTVDITEGSKTDPVISGYTFGTNGASALAGDVIIDRDSQYEYVWTKNGNTGSWEKLGDYEAYSLSDHTHGNITNGGSIGQTSGWTIASGDGLIVFDSSNSNKLERSSITFDGITTNKALTPAGTWETLETYTHPTGDGNSHIPATGTTHDGLYLKAGDTANSASWAAPPVWWGECTEATATKTVSCPGFTLTDGTIIMVHMTATNTGAVDSITLNVNGTGAKPIKFLSNENAPANIPGIGYLQAGNTYAFHYYHVGDDQFWIVGIPYSPDNALYGIRVYCDTVSDSVFNGEYPLLISRTAASSLTASYTDEIYAILNNTDRTKIPTYNPYTGVLTVPSISGNSSTATGANLVTTENAIAYYTDTTGTFGSKASANGALYATSANGTLQWGTLPIEQGGTAKTSWTQWGLVYADTTTSLAQVTAGASGNSGKALISNGAAAPDWYEGLSLTGSAAASWHAAFAGTTDASATNTAAVTIDGGLGIAKKLYVGSDTNISGQTIIDRTTTATSATLSSQLIVSNSSEGNVALELWRDTEASWQIANVDGNLYIRNDYTTSAQSTYSQDSIIINYNTGNTAIAGTLSVGQTTRNTTYQLYVNGTAYINDATTINGDLSFIHTDASTEGYITWSSSSYLQRIKVEDNTTTNDAVFIFQQSINDGASYVNLCTIRDDGTVVATMLNIAETSQLTGNVGIGAAPSSSSYILYVEGNSLFKGHIYPQADATYDLGLASSSNLRWRSLYLSDEIDMFSNSGSINLDSTGVITISAEDPQLILNTSVSGEQDWTIENDSGTFSLNNGSSIELEGTDNGFDLTSHLYINGTTPASNAYDLYVGGISCFTDNITYTDGINTTFSIDVTTPSIYPATTNTGTFGIAGGNTPGNARRWSGIYVGTADSYGDQYQSVYWNNGVPALTYPVQYFTWTISSGSTGVTLTGDDIFKDNTYNVLLVITSGESNLNAPLSWASSTDTFSIYTSVAVAGNVSGYAIVARGTNITNSITATQIIPS